jgi:serine/threonine protein kinase
MNRNNYKIAKYRHKIRKNFGQEVLNQYDNSFASQEQDLTEIKSFYLGLKGGSFKYIEYDKNPNKDSNIIRVGDIDFDCMSSSDQEKYQKCCVNKKCENARNFDIDDLNYITNLTNNNIIDGLKYKGVSLSPLVNGKTVGLGAFGIVYLSSASTSNNTFAFKFIKAEKYNPNFSDIINSETTFLKVLQQYKNPAILQYYGYFTGVETKLIYWEINQDLTLTHANGTPKAVIEIPQNIIPKKLAIPQPYDIRNIIINISEGGIGDLAGGINKRKSDPRNFNDEYVFENLFDMLTHYTNKSFRFVTNTNGNNKCYWLNHLDIKPENIMQFNPQPNNLEFKLIDFGLALEVDYFVNRFFRVGTPYYINMLNSQIDTSKNGELISNKYTTILYDIGSIILSILHIFYKSDDFRNISNPFNQNLLDPNIQMLTRAEINNYFDLTNLSIDNQERFYNLVTLLICIKKWHNAINKWSQTLINPNETIPQGMTPAQLNNQRLRASNGPIFEWCINNSKTQANDPSNYLKVNYQVNFASTDLLNKNLQFIVLIKRLLIFINYKNTLDLFDSLNNIAVKLDEAPQ